jgi:hypothetical protein
MTGLLITVFALFIVGFVVTIVAIKIDWRAFFQQRYGNDYRHGEAVKIINGVRTYYASEMWHEGSSAMSYWRQTKINGRTQVFDDVVPNPPPGVPMQYDSNGRRMYWLIPGNVICANAEKTSYQFTNYSPELMSSDMLDRTGVKFGTSVKDSGGGPGILVIVGIVLVVAIAGIFIFNAMRPHVVATQPPAAATANVTTPAGYPRGTIIGVPVPPDQVGK